MLKKVISILCLSALAFYLIACERNNQGGNSQSGTAQGESIQIKGSDTMVNLGQMWAEEFTKQHPGANIAVTGGGSGTGIANLINGACDIAESSREMEDRELKLAESKGMTPVKYIVALDGLAVVVNPSNPVSSLTMDQLRSIFIGNTTNWKDVGGTGGGIVALSREVNSGTHVFFKEHVLRRGNAKGSEEFLPGALLMPSSQAIADEVAQNPSAIGYFGMGYISPKVKALDISKDNGSPSYSPTIENVTSKNYPISRPLYLYFKGEPQGMLKTYLDFALSPEGQTIVRKMEFVPIK